LSLEEQQTELDIRPMTAGEYAKVQAVLGRINGLRRAMVTTAVVGMAISLFTFVYTGLHLNSVTGYFMVSYTAKTLAAALLYSIFAYLPVILVLGYFSNHVNKHIEKLAKGSYEKTIVLDYLMSEHVTRPMQQRVTQQSS
jgi:hypothetical protein